MTAAVSTDHYKILGVAEDADAAVIKTAYRKLVLKCHPDKVTGKEDEFQQVQQSYETLIDADKRQKYDRDRLGKPKDARPRPMPRSMSTGTTRVNVEIRTAHPPPEFRAARPSKTSAYRKPSSADFWRSWADEPPQKSKRREEEERQARKAVAEERQERLKREESRERKRQREAEELERQKRRLADEELKRELKREKEREREAQRDRERRRLREETNRKREQRLREDEEALREARIKEKRRTEQRERDRLRDPRRSQLEAEDRAPRSKAAYVEHYSGTEEDDRKNRSRRSSRKEGPTSRDKSSSKRSSPRDEARASPPPMPKTSEKFRSNMDWAATYINSTPKRNPDLQSHQFTEAFPDPEYIFKRRASGEAKKTADEQAHFDSTCPRERSNTQPDIPNGPVPPPMPSRQAPPPPPPAAPQHPPRLQKSYSSPIGFMTPSASAPPLPPRIPLGRAQTMEPEYVSSSTARATSGSGSGRTARYTARAFCAYPDEEDDYYHEPMRPRVHKYTVARDKGGAPPRVTGAVAGGGGSSAAAAPFGSRYRMASAYSADDLSTSRAYGKEDVLTSSYHHVRPSYTNYQTVQ